MRSGPVQAMARRMARRVQSHGKGWLLLAGVGLVLAGAGGFLYHWYSNRPSVPADAQLSAYQPPAEGSLTKEQAARRVRLAQVGPAPRHDPRSVAPAMLNNPRRANPAVRIPTVNVGVPELERRRVAEQSTAGTANLPEIQIVMGFDCSEQLPVRKLSPTHFEIDMDSERIRRGWFMFKVIGAAGRAVRIDFINAQLWKWSTLNPVYSYVTDLDDPASFACQEVKNPRPTAAANGPLLPDTSGQKWHFISQVWIPTARPRVGTLHLVQTFEKDAFVAMKYPYTPGYNQAFLKSLEGNPHCQVLTIGQSQGGRPLQMVKIGEGDPAKTPCVLMYGREHATEHDTSWAVEGAIRFLISDNPQAVAARRHCTFLLIPIMDPDGAAENISERITYSFTVQDPSPEALIYATWFEQWVDAGKRLDIALDLHNVASAEGEHLSCMYADPGRMDLCRGLHMAIARNLVNEGYSVRNQIGSGYMTTRLGGWLGYYFGPLPMLYEVNSQEKTRHLTLVEVRGIGHSITRAATHHLQSAAGDELKDRLDIIRRIRHLAWEANKSQVIKVNALSVEYQIRILSDISGQAKDNVQATNPP